MGAAALTSWLRQQIAAAGEDTSDEERSRRLESDAEAVQVLTIHRSKGVEFPIVYYPYLWEPGYIPRRPPARLLPRPAGRRRARHRRRHGRPRLPRPPAPARGRAARRGPAPRLCRADPRAASGRRVVGALVGQPQLRARPAALRPRRRGQRAAARVPRRRPTTPRPSPASRRSPLEAPGCISVERATLGLAKAWAGEARTAGGALRGPLRPRPRLALAAHVLQRHHRRRLRGASGERARGARRRRRGDDVRAAGPGAAPRRRPGVSGDARRAVAARRDAGRRPGRHLRAPRLRGDRLRRPRPRRRARRARRGDPGAPKRRRRRPGDHDGRPARRDRDAARAAARRPRAAGPRARRPPRRARSSSCRWSAATSRPGA